MKKKAYLKPTSYVIELQHRMQILCGSGNPYDDNFAYVPGIGKAESKLA